MGAIAALLPGLRELRAPLAAGYLWLLDLWLLFGTHIPSADEASGAIARLYELEGALAELGTGVALSFVAYLVGSLSEWVTTAAFTWFLDNKLLFVDRRALQETRAALLHQEREYAEYDRFRGEAEFRFAILPPLLLLVGLAAVGLDWRWAFLTVGVVALGVQGFYLLQQAHVILKRAARGMRDPMLEPGGRL